MVRVRNHRLKNCNVLYLLILGFLFLAPTNIYCSESAPPLLLSLDVERDSDVEALEKIGLKEPATYFVTGEFAKKYPKIINDLSKTGTIGSHSHSHPNLTELSLDDVRKDLQKSSKAIEYSTGYAPVWFRAPFLEVNDNVLAVARDLGFLYDSSEPERWVQQQILNEFPISINDTGRILFSDYDFFSSYVLDDKMALDMLKENYLFRLDTGRPFVFLLHPSIISEHTEVLHQFVSFVKDRGGSCLSFDQYLKNSQEVPVANNIGVRIDLSLGDLDIDHTIKDLSDAHVSDVFISARDTTGRNYYSKKSAKEGSIQAHFDSLVKGLHDANIRVHAWLPVLHNEALALSNPTQAMVDGLGQTSKSWVSPSHPQTIDNLELVVSELLSKYPLSGIHLDDLGYPGLDYDYSAVALKSFKVDTGIAIDKNNAPSVLPSQYYNEWVTWRSTQLGKIVKSVATELARVDRDIVLSASLNPHSLIDFRTMELSGQNYQLLAKDLDMIVALSSEDLNDVSPLFLTHFISMSRFKIGNRSLLIGLPAPKQANPPENVIKQLAKQLDTVRLGADGFLMTPYRNFLSYDRPETNQEATIRSLITAFRQPLLPRTTTGTPAPVAFATEVQAKPISNEKAIQPAKEYKRKGQTQLGTVIAGLVLFSFLGVRFIRSRRFYKSPISLAEPADIPNWRKLDISIRDNQLSGQLVHAVASHLRTYDPVRTSRYRVALIIDIVSKTQQQLNLNDLVTMSVGIPGWQVLAMSHLKEAVAHGYLQIDHDRITVTEKGTQELAIIKTSGFDEDHWVFVEQRLHESLNVSCPQCGEENLAHWYWSNFTCRKCNKEISVLDCTSISRRNAAIIGLDQHYYV